MGEAKPRVTGLIPMASVAGVERSLDFYKLLGMEVRNSLRSASGKLQWAHVTCEHADLMFTRASEPIIAGQHTVLLYMYSPDLVALRGHLLANGVKVSEITYPEYMPKGEVCLTDPDGYTLLIGQAE
jgi:hypothetical protein